MRFALMSFTVSIKQRELHIYTTSCINIQFAFLFLQQSINYFNLLTGKEHKFKKYIYLCHVIKLEKFQF